MIGLNGSSFRFVLSYIKIWVENGFDKVEVTSVQKAKKFFLDLSHFYRFFLFFHLILLSTALFDITMIPIWIKFYRFIQK